ncbi:MAG: hypothetical protein K0B15_06565 [Lentimicrobium sp.]|nr:hypothetical protein [Lentimicrobium sp.]
MKTIKFLIKSGRYIANNLLRFRFVTGSSITFTFRLSYAAFYNYNDVINSWHRIIAFSDFPLSGNEVSLNFINSSSGLKATFTFKRDNFKSNSVTLSDTKHFSIVPDTDYKVTVSRDKDSFVVFYHDEYYQQTIFSMMPKPLFNILFIKHPGLKGLFTLDKNLTVTIGYEI